MSEQSSPTNLSFLVQSILANRQANQHTALGHMMYGFFLWPFTLINSLLFAAGICAWAVWASRQRNAQSDLVERLIGKKSTAWLKHVERCNCVAGSCDALPRALSLSTVSLK